jgi:hypothetical protein
MPVDLRGTLRQAIGKLLTEKTRIERQIVGLRQALTAMGESTDGAQVRRSAASRRASRGMSPAARKAVSARMKAYWAKRKAARGKSKGRAA